MATIQDVARAAGVSPITVSRVFRNGDNVRPETRQRVLQAASELNYVPNAVARSLRQARSGLLAFINTDMMNPLFYAMARGAEDAAQAAGMTIVLGNSDDDPSLEAKYVRVMAEHRVDGIILIPTPTTTAARHPHPAGKGAPHLPGPATTGPHGESGLLRHRSPRRAISAVTSSPWAMSAWPSSAACPRCRPGATG